MNSIDLFIKTWPGKNTMVPINQQEITELEDKLKVTLPESFKYLLINYGLLHSPNVLTKTCDLGVDISQVQDFLSLEDIFSLSNLYQMTGLPKDYILFSSDCKGNMFCFNVNDFANTPSDPPVWFFDYANGGVKHVSPAFSSWLQEFSHLAEH